MSHIRISSHEPTYVHRRLENLLHLDGEAGQRVFEIRNQLIEIADHARVQQLATAGQRSDQRYGRKAFGKLSGRQSASPAPISHRDW
jgi:hypothetical protein